MAHHILEKARLAQHDILIEKSRKPGGGPTESIAESRFLLINFGVVVLLLFLFLRSKKPAPSHLRLGPKTLTSKPAHKVADKIPERNLNCMFQYNGHTWDAHEILGVPAGAPAETIKAGYEAAKKNSRDEQSKAILEAALNALRDRGQV